MTNNTIINLKEYYIQACDEIFPMFGLAHRFMCELSESTLNSTEHVNVLIELTHGLKGSIILGLSKEAALEIVSGLMGGMEITELDEMGQSALSEFMNMLSGNAIGKAASEVNKLIDISTPTISSGEEIFLIATNTPSKKLFFKLNESKFNIAYCIE